MAAGGPQPSPLAARQRAKQSIASVSSRSLRIEYSICGNWARSNFSGGIDMRHRARSAMAQMARNGWSGRALCSGEK